MKYKIWNKCNGWYLDLNKYCVTGLGEVILIHEDKVLDQKAFEVEIEEE